jgi:hypothetical protein
MDCVSGAQGPGRTTEDQGESSILRFVTIHESATGLGVCDSCARDKPGQAKSVSRAVELRLVADDTFLSSASLSGS